MLLLSQQQHCYCHVHTSTAAPLSVTPSPSSHPAAIPAAALLLWSFDACAHPRASAPESVIPLPCNPLQLLSKQQHCCCPAPSVHTRHCCAFECQTPAQDTFAAAALVAAALPPCTALRTPPLLGFECHTLALDPAAATTLRRHCACKC